jgi:hypothetical protein
MYHRERRNVHKERSLFKKSLFMNAYENSSIQVECKNGNKNYETYEPVLISIFNT